MSIAPDQQRENSDGLSKIRAEIYAFLEQKARALAAMEPYVKLDKYGRTTICDLDYGTDNYLLICRSIDKPVYKGETYTLCVGEMTAN